MAFPDRLTQTLEALKFSPEFQSEEVGAIRAEVLKSPLEKFLNPTDLDHPLYDIVMLHWVTAAKRAGLWEGENAGNEKHLFHQSYSFGGKRGTELIYRTTANMFIELGMERVINTKTAILTANMFNQLANQEKGLSYVLKEWPKEIVLTAEQKDYINDDLVAVKDAGIIIKDHFKDALKSTSGLKTVSLNDRMVEQLIVQGADFIDGLTGSAMFGIIKDIVNKAPEPSTTA